MGNDTAKRVTFLCSLAYFVSYCTRLGYAAGLVEMTRDLAAEKSLLSLGCTGLFITYGAGQFLSGWLGDRIPPRLLIALGLLGASFCNLSLSLFPVPGFMIGIWCINGLFQALLWPPMVRLMAEALDAEGYRRASKSVSVAANIATICVYACMSFFARVHLWRGYFSMAGIIGIAMAVVFLLGARHLPTGNALAPRDQKKPEKQKMRPVLWACGLPLIMVAIVMQGMLRDGVSTWMPSLIADTAGLGSASSILSAAVLPIFSVICINIASYLQKRAGNDVHLSLLLFIVSGICSVILYPLLRSATAGIVCMAVITGCAHAINYLLICHVPSYFASYGCVSSVSGLINSCTYIGSAISTYGIAVVSLALGWGATVVLWVGISAVGALCCLGARKRWTEFTRQDA